MGPIGNIIFSRVYTTSRACYWRTEMSEESHCIAQHVVLTKMSRKSVYRIGVNAGA
jgi:hypothetical protein